MAQQDSPHVVVAKRWALGWDLELGGVRASAASLAEAQQLARRMLATQTGVPEDEVIVSVTPDLGGAVMDEVQRTRQAMVEARDRMNALAECWRNLAAGLRARGLHTQDTATILGVSSARASQLIQEYRDRHRP